MIIPIILHLEGVLYLGDAMAREPRERTTKSFMALGGLTVDKIMNSLAGSAVFILDIASST